MSLHTAIETSGYLGDRVDDSYLSNLDLILLDIKSSDPDIYLNLTGCDRLQPCVSRNGSRQ